MRQKKALAVLAFGVVLLTVSCTSTGYNTQKGAAIGAAVGALAGQVIGNNTASTLIGAAGGALGGAIVGNAIDQSEVERKLENTQHQSVVTAPVSPEDQPPGKWVEIPGQWSNGKWVPAHRVWVPVNPGDK
jgi:outer membrane lipoprotein SlyB